MVWSIKMLGRDQLLSNLFEKTNERMIILTLYKVEFIIQIKLTHKSINRINLIFG